MLAWGRTEHRSVLSQPAFQLAALANSTEANMLNYVNGRLSLLLLGAYACVFLHWQNNAFIYKFCKIKEAIYFLLPGFSPSHHHLFPQRWSLIGKLCSLPRPPGYPLSFSMYCVCIYYTIIIALLSQFNLGIVLLWVQKLPTLLDVTLLTSIQIMSSSS